MIDLKYIFSLEVSKKWGINSILLPLVFGIWPVFDHNFCNFLYFEFNSLLIFFARKMIRMIHFMSSSKMINLFQDAVTNVPHKMWNAWLEVHTRFMRTRFEHCLINMTQLKIKNHCFLKLRISILCQDKKIIHA